MPFGLWRKTSLVNQNRMSSSSSFSGFSARVREFIGVSSEGTQQSDGGANPFDNLARELFALQYRHNAAYRQLCNARGLTPETVEHWSQIPSVPTAAFKELELSCLPAEERTAVFHSSGTTEQRPSRHFHNAQSLALYEASLRPWFARHLLPEAKPDGAKPTMVMLTPPHAETPHSSLVHMFETVRRELGAADSAFYGTVGADGVWTLNTEAVEDALARETKAGRPVMLLGTAFLFVHLLDDMASRRVRLALPPGSRVLETGGYKGRSRSLPKAELHGLITKHLGLPATHIVCEYGMSELSTQAYDRVAGSEAKGQGNSVVRCFHFPPWARVQIISPETGREVRDGETGLIRIMDLANVFSVMAIQTEDLGLRRGDGFELIGRAALAEARGCSLMAV
jgi:hypothetical protein